MDSNTPIFAHKLAKRFLDENEIPQRFRKGFDNRTFKYNPDTLIEKKFQEEVNHWCNLIEIMILKIEKFQAYRFIQICPNIEPNIKSAIDCQDYSDFLDYLVLRRDIENCDDEELGRLAMLSGAFQKEIENQSKPKKQIHLKNNLANSLLEQEKIVVEGIEINLWRGHSIDSVNANETWNKIKSYIELNSLTEGKNGSIVFTGIMQIPRQEASEYAVKLGFKVHAQPSSKTDFIVLGSENVSPTKIAEAMEFNNRGANIKFVDELTFLSMINDDIIIDK
jgi:NAD-dependent DNA ligase